MRIKYLSYFPTTIFWVAPCHYWRDSNLVSYFRVVLESLDERRKKKAGDSDRPVSNDKW